MTSNLFIGVEAIEIVATVLSSVMLQTVARPTAPTMKLPVNKIKKMRLNIDSAKELGQINYLVRIF